MIRTLAAALATTTCIVALATPAMAQTREFNIPAGSLKAALDTYARQSGRQVIYGGDVRSARSPGVRGARTADDALDAILAGTGFVVKQDRSGALAIVKGGNGPAAAQTAAALGEAKTESAPAEQSADIVVTGTNIRGVVPIGSHIVAVDRAEMTRSGFTSSQEVIQSISQNSQAGAVSDFGAAASSRGKNTTLGSGLNLRGLGARESLVLLDGHRLAPGSNGTFVDISTIPLAAIERVEVLADGASATYGSDAVAGVVNFVLRKNYHGAESTANYRLTPEGGREIQLSQLIGHSWSSGNIMLGYEYTNRQSINNSQRKVTSNCDLTSLGGSNFCSLLSNPGNITRVGSTATTLGIPANQNGLTLTEASLLSSLNTYNDRASVDAIPGFTRHSGFGSVRQDLGDRVSVFGTALYSHRSFNYQSLRSGVTLTVPETNAYRRANGLFAGRGNLTIGYSLIPDLGEIDYTGSSESWSASMGGEVKIGSDWRLRAVATESQQRDKAFSGNNTDTTALTAALASSDITAAFNPFGAGSNTATSVLAAIGGSKISQDLTAKTFTTQLLMDGPLVYLPGGAVRLAGGLERRKENSGFRQIQTSSAGVITSSLTSGVGGYSAIDREVKAAFGELSIPVFGEGNRLPGLYSLGISASVRYERYSDFGSTTNPKLGVSWSPIEIITLRGTYGTSFSVANLNDVLNPVFAQSATVTASTDPKAGASGTTTLVVGGGNPSLQPEHGRTFTFGAHVAAPFARSLSFDVTYFNVRIRDSIATVSSLKTVFTQDAAYQTAGVLIRNPNAAQVAAALARASTVIGSIPAASAIQAIIFSIPQNVAALQADGLDLQLNYELPTKVGNFIFVGRGSYLFTLSQNPATGLDPVQNAGKVGFPSRFSGRGSISWWMDKVSANASVNFVGAYTDNLSSPSRRIEPWWTFDASFSYQLPMTGVLGGLTAGVYATNLFNTAPPFVNNSSGIAYDPANANPIGRQISFRLTKKW